MTYTDIPTALADWIVAQAVAGYPPEQALQPLLDQGWSEQDAIDAVETLVRAHIQQHAQANGLPVPVRVPALQQNDDASLLTLGDREVRVLVSLLLPRVVVLGGFLSDAECDALIALAQPRLARSRTVDYDRPHPMTRSLHAGAPVLAGEKWVATKWLRERAVHMPG
ncbi:hypothetical protein [Xanthomonas nasturtii]|uniref:hypothetical protein n=1 Tax=Xanthomonas nasturtii TaxID=1843581 RepID=UPI00201111CC|nr:hypothetical protein [Xanthomonas nasturtii]MCL1500518.1 hypothetical protein [Xanthomonas nasturtii]MCL1504342.1 hypothetical protein [Xanthomonas nasturtii]MCL1523319.1 hypothetical protein [Xanthomonas nasturtii]